jgi:two-component system, cell cycle response regulator
VATRPDAGSAPATILLVQDNPADVYSTGRILAEAFDRPPSIVSLPTVDAACAHLRDHPVDIVLLDLGLADQRGLEASARLLHEASGTPLVVLTELHDQADAEVAVALGAHDYLVKGRFTAAVAGRALRYATERHRLQSRLDEMSLTDRLTGLTNRRGFAVRAEDDLRRARRSGTPFVLGVADVAGLSHINALHGRLEGDRALRDAASVLRTTFRDSDVLARIGGDEFALLLRDTGPECQERARRRLAYRLIEHNDGIDRRWRLNLRLTFSPGRAEQSASVDQLLAALPPVADPGAS